MQGNVLRIQTEWKMEVILQNEIDPIYAHSDFSSVFPDSNVT